MTKAFLALSLAVSMACARPSGSPREPLRVVGPRPIAQVYYWRAKPGKLEEYSRYVAEVAEPIDEAARREGAFVSVTTYVSRDSTVPWTHMRIFILRDSVQWRGLSAALDRAGVALEPDSAKRRARGEYSATLRDRVGSAVFEVLP
jgi:hypothetical protein